MLDSPNWHVDRNWKQKCEQVKGTVWMRDGPFNGIGKPQWAVFSVTGLHLGFVSANGLVTYSEEYLRSTEAVQKKGFGTNVNWFEQPRRIIMSRGFPLPDPNRPGGEIFWQPDDVGLLPDALVYKDHGKCYRIEALNGNVVWQERVKPKMPTVYTPPAVFSHFPTILYQQYLADDGRLWTREATMVEQNIVGLSDWEVTDQQGNLINQTDDNGISLTDPNEIKAKNLLNKALNYVADEFLRRVLSDLLKGMGRSLQNPNMLWDRFGLGGFSPKSWAEAFKTINDTKTWGAIMSAMRTPYGQAFIGVVGTFILGIIVIQAVDKYIKPGIKSILGIGEIVTTNPDKSVCKTNYQTGGAKTDEIAYVDGSSEIKKMSASNTVEHTDRVNTATNEGYHYKLNPDGSSVTTTTSADGVKETTKTSANNVVEQIDRINPATGEKFHYQLNPDGSSVIKTTSADGSTSKETSYPDGSSVKTTTSADGVKETTKTSAQDVVEQIDRINAKTKEEYYYKLHPDGSSVTKTTSADGSTSKKTSYPDGSSVKTMTSADGVKETTKTSAQDVVEQIDRINAKTKEEYHYKLNPDGSSVTKTTSADGSTSKETSYPDGSSVKTTTSADGVKETTKTSAQDVVERIDRVNAATGEQFHYKLNPDGSSETIQTFADRSSMTKIIGVDRFITITHTSADLSMVNTTQKNAAGVLIFSESRNILTGERCTYKLHPEGSSETKKVAADGSCVVTEVNTDGSKIVTKTTADGKISKEFIPAKDPTAELFSPPPSTSGPIKPVAAGSFVLTPDGNHMVTKDGKVWELLEAKTKHCLAKMDNYGKVIWVAQDYVLPEYLMANNEVDQYALA